MANLEQDEFAKHLNTTFHVHEIEPSLDLKLIEVSELKKSAGTDRFWLILNGPNEPFLPQGTYQLQHDKMGDFEIFTVPVSQDANGYYYQAVFNRLVEDEGKA